MKVARSTFSRPALRARASIVLSFSFILLFSVFTAPAGAITRNQVLGRAMSWVKHRVPYSQHAYRAGYRRDCSGFVSMAWNLGRSYTSSTISSKGTKVAPGKLKPGDAVLVRGRHVSLFDGWVNKKRGLYVAIEQTTWGDHVRKHARTIPGRAIGIRRRGIIDRPRVLLASQKVAAPSSAAPPVLVASALELSPLPATLQSALASDVVVPPAGSLDTMPALASTVASACTPLPTNSPMTAPHTAMVAGLQL